MNLSLSCLFVKFTGVSKFPLNIMDDSFCLALVTTRSEELDCLVLRSWVVGL